MSQVEFEETRTPSYYRNVDNTPKIIKGVIKYSGGLIKNERQANYILIAIIVISFIYPFISFSGENPNSAAIYPVLPAEY